VEHKLACALASVRSKPLTHAMPDEAMATHPNRLLWLGVILALVVGLPFLNKPFHIDDTVVLAVAKQITRDPLRPLSADINWFGDPRSLFQETTNPPFVSYFLAPVVAGFGYSEAPLHLAMLVFLIILGVAMASLSRRFAGGSPWPVLFVMLSPAVVVSTNVMRDVPLAALSAAAAALFVAGVDRRRWPLALAGGLVAGLAILTKYSGVVLVPALMLYALLQRRSRYALWPLVALVVLGLWCLQNLLVHGRLHLTYLMAERRGEIAFQDRFYATWVTLGACLFLLPALVAAFARRAGAGLLACAAIAAGFALYGARLHLQGPVGWQYGLWAITGAALAFLLIVPGLAAARRLFTRDDGDAADSFFLAAWLIGVLGFSIFFVMFQAVRHVIPALVPAALLAIRVMPRIRWLSVVLGVLLALQALVAFAVAAADYEYADTYRAFAREAQRRLARPGHEVWFVGHWGWQRYALSAGFTQAASRGPRPRPGSLFIVPERVDKGSQPEGLALKQIEEKTCRGRIPIHTMDGSVGASFYSVVGRAMPYVFTRERTLETFRVFRVGAKDECRMTNDEFGLP